MDAVEVAPAHRQRVQPQLARNVAQDGFNDDHALRPAKAAKGRVALGVGLAAVGRDVYVLQKVGVVGMKNRAVGHGARQVGAEAAVDGHHQLQAGNAPAVVKARAVIVGKRVALAGDQEVVIAVQAQLDRALELARRDGGPHREVAGLGFLAAKAAAHAPAFDTHRVLVNAQRVRHPVLHLAGVLRAGINQPLVLLLGQHVGDLAFKVEMLLAADFQRAMQGVQRAFQRLDGITALHKNRWQHIALRLQGITQVQDGGQDVDVAAHLARGAPGLHHRFGHHHADHLADVLHGAMGKHRPVVREVAQHPVTGNVARQNHAAYAGHRQRRCRVHVQQPAMRHGRKNRCGIQRAPDFRDVVHIGGGTRHLGAGALVKG